ncbi:MAG TPA: amidohydrolase family protein [Terriglobia bacterium]|nr:amidohydrolase family protein [Terriglobia bacterium]
MLSRHLRALAPILLGGLLTIVPALHSQDAWSVKTDYEFNDEHFHLTNYIQEGTPIREFLKIMGNTTGRSVLFGIPLQQQWSYRISGDDAPTYYLHTDAPLYYYSFTDADIAAAYLSLSPRERARFDPLITGFNPTDMYAADHIRRVLRTFPGVFCGIGEFSIHKEFVSSKVAGGVASLFDPALDRIFDLAEEAGLVVLVHNDVDIPFASPGKPPSYLDGMKALLQRHPRTTIIWAHMGVGRVVRPIRNHARMIEDILRDPEMGHVMFDISWDEVAKYLVATPESLKIASDLINRYADRILFGTDSVAPKDQQEYLKTYRLYDPLWALLTKDARVKVRKTNYERIFDEARKRVPAWEARQLPGSIPVLPITR